MLFRSEMVRTVNQKLLRIDTPETGYFSTSVSNVAGVVVSPTMNTVITFPNVLNQRYIVDSILITNTDTTGATNVSITSNIQYNSGQQIVHANAIPIAYRSALEILKKPQIFNPGESLRLQSNYANIYATITYETITGTQFVGQGTFLNSFNTTNVYQSNTYPTIVDSIRLVNAGSSNVGATVKWTDSSGTNVKSVIVFELILPYNSVVELCDGVKRIEANDIITAYASYGNLLGIFVSGKQLVP